jgi:hypothetical protein
MSASIFVQSKSYFDVLVEKYSANPFLSFDEMKSDFSMVKPSGVPIADIALIRFIGDYIINTMVQHQWDASPYIINHMHFMVKVNFPNLYFSMADFGSAIMSHRNKNKSPTMIDMMVLDFVDPYLKDFHNFDGAITDSSNSQSYFKDRMTLRTKTKEITDKYDMVWEEIEKKFDELEEVLTSSFEDIENDPVYQAAFEIIDEITDSASAKVESLIDYYTTMMHEHGGNFEEHKKKVTHAFEIAMNKVYHDLIVVKNFDNTTYKTISSLYDAEKKKYMMFLSLNFVTIAIKQMSS